MPQIRLTLRPGGASCNHVLIKDTDGNPLQLATIAELSSSINKTDGPLMAQIKRISKDANLPEAALKNRLKNQDFEF